MPLDQRLMRQMNTQHHNQQERKLILCNYNQRQVDNHFPQLNHYRQHQAPKTKHHQYPQKYRTVL